MNWLGLNWDDEAQSQLKNKTRHLEVVNELVKKDKAYKCFCSEDEIQSIRNASIEKGKAKLFDSSKSAASTWVFTIGRNKRIDHLRRQKHPVPSQDDLISNNVENTYEVSMEKEQLFTMMKSFRL